ncbi:MAG TPA: class I adenylate-forming enzyme family protein [Acidimicrobiales bacterium]|nr:class I adenylate-forming enzyme family protein [Acidimicrobiales bacterium]
MADLLVRDLFRNAAAAVPDRVAAVHDGAGLTFGELHRRGRAVAVALARRGVRRGDRVVVWAGTTLDQLPVFVALAELGAVYAPVSGLFTVDEAEPLAAPLRPALLLVDGPRAADAPALAARLDAPFAAVGSDLAPDDADSAAFVAPELSEDDTHAVFFTSGSTGRSKGVVLSHRVSWLRSHPGALVEPRGPFVCPYPMFHMAVWTQALQQWHARGTIVFTTGDAADICAAVTEHRAERINAIPGVWRRIVAHMASLDPGVDHDLGSLRFADTGTSATPPDLLAALRKLLPQAQIRVFYGSTETGAATMLADADLERKPGSAGAVAPFTEIRLSAEGELQVRGPQVFDGYHDDPAANAEAFTGDGWYRSGDLAELDDEGFVTIVGRTGDLIRTGGEAVVPGEVEAVVVEHPAVGEVAVVGLPDPSWGQLVCAVVVPAAGHEAPTVDELAGWSHDRLARFKRPRRVVAADALPRTPSTGQVQRRRLAALIAAADTSMRGNNVLNITIAVSDDAGEGGPPWSAS